MLLVACGLGSEFSSYTVKQESRQVHGSEWEERMTERDSTEALELWWRKAYIWLPRPNLQKKRAKSNPPSIVAKCADNTHLPCLFPSSAREVASQYRAKEWTPRLLGRARGGLAGISPDGCGPKDLIGSRMSPNIVWTRSLTLLISRDWGRAAGTPKIRRRATIRHTGWREKDNTDACLSAIPSEETLRPRL